MKAEEKFDKIGYSKKEDDKEIDYFKTEITKTRHIVFDKEGVTICGYIEEHPFCRIEKLPIDIVETGAILTQLSELEKK